MGILLFITYRERVYVHEGINQWVGSLIKLVNQAEKLDILIEEIREKTTVSLSDLVHFDEEYKLFLEQYNDLCRVSKQYNIESQKPYIEINNFCIKEIEKFTEFKKQLDSGITVKFEKDECEKK